MKSIPSIEEDNVKDWDNVKIYCWNSDTDRFSNPIVSAYLKTKTGARLDGRDEDKDNKISIDNRIFQRCIDCSLNKQRQKRRGEDMTIAELKAMDESADYWRYDIGINVIPADTKNKKPLAAWSEWQDKPIPEELHNKWKSDGSFSKGIAIIPGNVCNREDKKGIYFIFIDADSKKAI